MQNPSALQVFLFGYIIWVPLLVVAYGLAPQEYPVMALDDLQPSQSKVEILNFLYTSLLTKITTWYQGMVGCVFGVFSVMALLASHNVPQKARIVVAIVGGLIVLLTAFILYKTISTYTMMCVVERSYPVNATQHPDMLAYFQELNNISGPFAHAARVSNLTLRDVTVVFGGCLAGFIWPALYVIATLYYRRTGQNVAPLG